MVFLAGIGSEHEQTGKIMYPGNFAAQCRYAYRKLKKVLARNGGGMADVVKQVTYVIDARHQQAAGECRRQAYGRAPLPAPHIPQRQSTRLARHAGRNRRHRDGAVAMNCRRSPYTRPHALGAPGSPSNAH
jgi:enamine deaminase RidA (YjgF/YER057c/UK114 family)